jgi:hypothetical protein
MAIASEQLAQLTARMAVLRMSTGRLGAFGPDYELKADSSGQIIWNRATATDGDPGASATWTTERE